MHSSSFDNKYVIIACCEGICCRSHVQKDNILDHFHLSTHNGLLSSLLDEKFFIFCCL